MADDLGEKCGLFGVYHHPEAAKLTYLGLYALQHRGQESSGIVSSDGNTLHAEIGMGLVADVFNERRLAKLPGHMAIGHNRYSTTGSSLLRNAQPMVIGYAGGSLAIAHNGNLVNAMEIRRDLEQQGAIFRSTTDTEVIVHLIARSAETKLADQVVDALRKVQGAYSLLLMTEKEMIGVRDSFGFRPLVVGRLADETFILSSETCARFRCARSPRICRGSTDPLRDGTHSQSLCGPDFHRASAVHTSFWHQGQIKSGQTVPAWQACSRGGRFDCTRDNGPEDRHHAQERRG